MNKLMTSAATLVLAFAATAASAQQAPTNVEEVVITGSRIRTSPLEQVQPERVLVVPDGIRAERFAAMPGQAEARAARQESSDWIMG